MNIMYEAGSQKYESLGFVKLKEGVLNSIANGLTIGYG